MLEALKQDENSCGQYDADEQVNHPVKVGFPSIRCVTRMEPIGPCIDTQLSRRQQAMWEGEGMVGNGRRMQTTAGSYGTPPALDFIPSVLLEEVIQHSGATLDQQAGEVEFGIKPLQQGIQPFLDLPGQLCFVAGPLVGPTT